MSSAFNKNLTRIYIPETIDKLTWVQTKVGLGCYLYNYEK